MSSSDRSACIGTIFVMTADPATAAAAARVFCAGSGQCTPNGIAYGLDLDDTFLDDGVRRQWLDGVVFNAVTTARLTQLQQLYGR
jgi:hypothetical protein